MAPSKTWSATTTRTFANSSSSPVRWRTTRSRRLFSSAECALPVVSFPRASSASTSSSAARRVEPGPVENFAQYWLLSSQSSRVSRSVRITMAG